MSTLHAQPYDLHAAGFYFTSLEEFQEKSADHINEFGQPVEEYEIQFIDGDNPELFESAGINQATLEYWFDELEDISGDDDLILAIRFLMDNNGYDIETALEKADEVIIHHGTAEDYAAEIIEETTDMDSLPDIIKFHIDFDGIAHDMKCNGELVEVSRDVWVTNACCL